MNKPILGALCAVLFALVACNTIGHAEENAAASPAAWSVDSKFTANLSEEVDGEWFTIRPPKELDRMDVGDTTAYDRAGIKIAVWTKEMKRPANPTITIMALPAPTAGHSNQEFFQGVLDSLTAKWPTAKGSKIEEGLWNGRPALRSDFTATDENGELIRGVVLCDADETGTFSVCVMNSGDSDDDSAELETLTNAAISCSLKR